MVGRITRALALAVTLAMVALVAGSGTQSASAAQLKNQYGAMKVKKVTGTSDNGATFAGQYKVRKFVERGGTLMAVGKLTGDLTTKNGKTKAVSERVKMPVTLPVTAGQSAPATSSAKQVSAASCEILTLVLGPLDLDLLGLVIHLDRVVLTITAEPGSGNLLGNLLCAVAGLLDGASLPNLNDILADLLTAILGILRL